MCVGRFFATRARLFRHHSTVHLGKTDDCELCGKAFRRKDGLKEDLKEVHKYGKDEAEESTAIKTQHNLFLLWQTVCAKASIVCPFDVTAWEDGGRGKGSLESIIR